MSTADRIIRSEIVVDAPPERVWQVLTDFSRLARVSPELIAMIPLKPGGLRVGQWYLGLNKRGAALWTTRNVIAELVPHRRIAWDTTTSGARWTYELTGVNASTRVTETRTIPRELTTVGRVYAALFLGGGAHHTDQLDADISETLAGLKHLTETSN